MPVPAPAAMPTPTAPISCMALKRSTEPTRAAPTASAAASWPPVPPTMVEIDETSLPFRTKNDPAGGGPERSHDGKLLVVGGIEVGDGNKPGRLRLAALTDYGAGSLNAFIARNIAPASTAKTDGWAGYAGVPVDQHDPRVIGAMAAHLVLWDRQVAVLDPAC